MTSAAQSLSAGVDLLGDREFNELREKIQRITGIELADSKRDMVYRRLVGRLKELNLPDFAAYCDYLDTGNRDEIAELANAVTTNLTYFFREPHHFEYLENEWLPAIRNSGKRHIRIWSAGCSSGEEPYSLAISLYEALGSLQGWDIRILATDLDSNMLDKCRAGVYSEDQLSRVPEERRSRWFKRGKGPNAGKVKVRPELAELIAFKQLNLMGDWPMKGMFDIIICRNVMIYFDKPTQRRLVDRFAGQMAPNNHLIVGHSESLLKVSDRFQLLKKTIYQRVS